jgi:tRNA A-37 threonylcarbamoyl transferase component Bud32
MQHASSETPEPLKHPGTSRPAPDPQETLDPEGRESVLGEQLDRHLEALRSTSKPQQTDKGDPELEQLRPVVEQLHALAQYLTTPVPTGPETLSYHSAYSTAVPPPSESDRREKWIGKYTVVRALGEGGQASATLAFDPDLQRHVVLKMYREARTPKQQESVLREGQALARVRSRYVAQCYGVERHEGVPYLVVEYIPGKNLAELQKAKPQTIDGALELTAQLAEGLAAIHACGLLHRDIKPANIIMGDDGVPRLVDFGMAVPLASANLRQIAGTLSYMAPEQARGEIERIDARSDLFGLGAVLYELLTGRPPHRADTLEALLEAAQNGDVVPPCERNPKVPAAVNDLCMRCLAKDPLQRFASAAELGEAVRRWQQRPRWRNWFVLSGRLGRHKLRITIATALLLLGLISVFPLYWTGAPRPGTEAEPALRHPDGRPLRRDFPIEVEMLGGEREARGQVTLTEGEMVRFRIELERDAYVGVWYVDDLGAVVQLFPNRFDRDHRLRAGQARDIPPADADYAIKATVSHGLEYVHVVASTKKWESLEANRSGPYTVFSTDEEKEHLQTFLRGLELTEKEHRQEDARPAASEAIVPFRVFPRN